MNSPVLPALRSRGRDGGIPAGADVDVVVVVPPLPSISWFNSRPNLQAKSQFYLKHLKIKIPNHINALHVHRKVSK